MNKFILIPILLFILCGCSSANNIIEIDCEGNKVVFGDPSFGVGFKSQYIINRKTGEYYEYDEFTEKLKLLTGKGENEEGWKYTIKSVVVDKKWKKQEIVEGLSLKDKGKSYLEIDLNTLRYSETNYDYAYNWEKVWSVEGICRFKKPKTTEILNEK